MAHKNTQEVSERRKRDHILWRIKTATRDVEIALDRHTDLVESNALQLQAYVEELINHLGIIQGDDITLTD